MRQRGDLERTIAPVTSRISALWVSVMFCFVYGDFFNLYRPGKIAALLAGRTPMGPVDQGLLLAFSALMALPAAMIFLTLVAPPVIARPANIVVASVYAALMSLAIQKAWAFYVFMGMVEIALLATIIWSAAKWPRRSAAA